MRYLFALCFAITSCLLSSCLKRAGESKEAAARPDTSLVDHKEVAPADSVHQSVPAVQHKALETVVPVDSTESTHSSGHDGNYIYISKPQMRLYVLNSRDSVIYSCGIACGIGRGNKRGKGDYRTPEGRFSISGIFESTDWVHRTRRGRMVKGCYGPYFLRLATGRFSGIGIHGTNAPGSIGRRASEGCIRVKTANIITIRTNYAYDGMPVIVSGERERLPRFAGLTAESAGRSSRTAHLASDSAAPVKHRAVSVSYSHPMDSLSTPQGGHVRPAEHADSLSQAHHHSVE